MINLTEPNEKGQMHEGFIIDLLDELSLILGFKYTIYEQAQRGYGSEEASGKWNGMIGDLIERDSVNVSIKQRLIHCTQCSSACNISNDRGIVSSNPGGGVCTVSLTRHSSAMWYWIRKQCRVNVDSVTNEYHGHYSSVR